MKYTFEIMKEYEDAFKGISVYSVSEDKKLMVDFVALEELEDAQKQVEDAYQRGLEEGKKATWGLVADASSAEYQRGLEDAWEAARKLFSSMADSDIEKAFPTEWNNGGFNALMNFQPQEAIAKLKAYEEKQKADDSIIAGDEVKAEDGTAVFFVTWMSDRCICGIDKEGKCYSYEPKEICGKTGRHFDIILEEKRE